MDRLDTLTIFVTVAELESFAAAARRLNRTPAAVTRSVADLEAHLRTRLLNRTTRSVSLTDEGARYLDVGRRLLATYAEFEGIDADASAPPHGSLHVTAPTAFGRLHVLPLVTDFLVKYPAIDVKLLLLDRTVSLVDEGIDVGIRLGHLPDSSLRATRSGQARSGVWASPKYLAEHGAPATPKDLSHRPVISCTALLATPDRWSFEGAGGVGTIPVTPRLVVNSAEAAAEAAARGLGLAMLVTYQAAPHVTAGRLVEVLQDFQMPPFPIHLIQPAGRYAPRKVRVFIDEISLGLRRRFGDK